MPSQYSVYQEDTELGNDDSEGQNGHIGLDVLECLLPSLDPAFRKERPDESLPEELLQAG